MFWFIIMFVVLQSGLGIWILDAGFIVAWVLANKAGNLRCDGKHLGDALREGWGGWMPCGDSYQGHNTKQSCETTVV